MNVVVTNTYSENSLHENLPVCNSGIVYQDFQYVLVDNLHSKHYYTYCSYVASKDIVLCSFYYLSSYQLHP